MLTADQLHCTSDLETGLDQTVMTSTAYGPDLVVLIVADKPGLARTVRPICDFIGLRVIALEPGADLAIAIETLRPITIMVACDSHDGDEVLQVIARYDAGLPTLLVGCGEAVERLTQLQHVLWLRNPPSHGDVADFLFHACRMRAGSALMPL
jgi:hypothetical protein